MKYVFSFILILLVLCGNAQSKNALENEPLKKWSYTVFASAGVNTLYVEPRYTQKFSNTEFRLGAGIQYKIFDFLDLKSRLALGFRLKREPTDPNPSFKTVPFPYYALDEMTSQNNYFFYEIPLVLQFNVLHDKLGLTEIGLRSGVSFRHFLPIDHQGPPYLPNDFGLLTGIQIGITKNISIGTDYYFGLLHTTKIGYSSDSGSGILEAWNRFGMVSLDYKLGK